MTNRKGWLPVVLVTLLAVAAAAAGCSRASGPAEGDPSPPESQPAAEEQENHEGGRVPPAGGEEEQTVPGGAGMDRPEEAERTILLEGMEETIGVRLFATPALWPLEFSTYHPDDWVAEAFLGERGPVVRFTVAYGGRRNDDAYLEVAAYPTGIDETAARRRLADLASELGLEQVSDRDHRYPWSLAEYVGTGGVVQGLALGRHGDQWFHVHWHYPAEHADGFGPRQALILEEWIWADNGLPLDPGK